MDLEAAAIHARPIVDGPRPDVVEQHRRALHDAIAHATHRSTASIDAQTESSASAFVELHPPYETERAGRGRQLVRAAAAAVLVAAVVGPIAWKQRTSIEPATSVVAAQPDADSGEQGPLPTEPDAVAASGEQGTVLNQPYDAGSTYKCEQEPPDGFLLPDSYVRPLEGPSPDTVAAVQDGQHVRYWTSETGTAELRQPPDAAYASETSLEDPNFGGLSRDTTPTDTAAMMVIVLPEGDTTTPEGRPAKVLMFGFPTESGCSLTQLTVFDDEPAQIDMTLDLVLEALVGAQAPPLVVGAITITETPSVALCQVQRPGQVSDGGLISPEDVPPNLSATFTGFSTYAAPAEALEALVDGDGDPVPLATRGYLEMAAPDGTIYYARLLDTDDSPRQVTALIHAIPVEQGWTIASWEVTGC